MLRLILEVSESRVDADVEREYPPGTKSGDAGKTRPGTRNRDAEKTHSVIAIRKCFLFLNERVTAISIRGSVAIDFGRRRVRVGWRVWRVAVVGRGQRIGLVLGARSSLMSFTWQDLNMKTVYYNTGVTLCKEVYSSAEGL